MVAFQPLPYKYADHQNFFGYFTADSLSAVPTNVVMKAVGDWRHTAVLPLQV